MKIVIVEDEKNNVLLIKELLKKLPFETEVVFITDEVDEATKIINREKPDLLLLDILIKGGTSFDILEKIEPYSFETIFITAYNQYAIDAIKKQTLDYLLKPIVGEEFLQALTKCKKRIEEKSKLKELDGNNNQSYFTIKTHNGTELIPLHSIIYFEADGSYTKCITDKNILIVSKNVGDIEKELPSDVFYRCHHSYIINVKHIEKIELNRSGSITCSNGNKLPVSQRKKREFMDFITRSKIEVL